MPSIAHLPEVIAFVATLVAWHGVRSAAKNSPLAARLRTVYALVCGVMGLRLVDFWLDFTPISIATMILASWLPLAALLLVEQICRRHAPQFVKIGILGGAIFFTVIAFTAGLYWDGAALIGLAVFQAIAAAAMAIMLINSRRSMVYAERQIADAFLLTVVLTIPLALTDFDVILTGMPMRGGGFAAIILVLATSRLARGEGSPLSLLGDMVVCLVGAAIGLAATYLIALGEPTNSALIAASSVGFLAAALAMLVERFANVRADNWGLVNALARIPEEAPLADVVRAHPLLSSARMVDSAMLASYPQTAVRALAHYRVIDRDMADERVRDPARDILHATAATHLLRLSIEPPRFLAVSGGELTGSALRDELLIAAMLMEKRV